MAKTLIYAAGSPRQVKIGDTDTVLYLQIAKDNVNVDLTKVQTIQVKIADKESFLKTITIDKNKLAYDPTNGVVELPMSKDNIGGLPTNTYQFEVWITTADSENEIYPDVGVAVFSIISNIEGGSVVYTSLTLQDFYNAFSDLAITAKNDHNVAVADSSAVQQNTQAANAAVNSAQQVLNELNSGGYAKQTDIDSLSYDNLNLLTGTTDKGSVASVTGWGEINLGENGTNIPVIKGQPYTAKVFLFNPSHEAMLEVIGLDDNGNGIKWFHGTKGSEGTNFYSSITFVPDVYSKVHVHIVFEEQQTDITATNYNKPKLEFGLKSTPWTPNPDDKANQSDLLLKADNSEVMHNTGDETSTGQKTFMNGNYGFRISSTGPQKTTDGGTTWANI